MNILTSKSVKWFFRKYFGIPKEKEIFRLGRNFIDYWEDKKKGIAKRHDYGQALTRINPWVGLLFESERGGTDTGSTNNADAMLYEDQADINYGGLTVISIGERSTEPSPNHNVRGIFDWTLSSGSGTISLIKLYLYCSQYARTITANVHELSQASAFVEGEATYNIWKTGSSWATPGGDYSATVVDTTDIDEVDTWFSWVLQGEGATNPIVGLTWGSNFDLLLKEAADIGETTANNVNTKEAASEKPYIEITYSVGATYTKTVSMDALLRAQDEKTVALDAYLKAVDTKSVTIDALLNTIESKTVDLDALLKAIDTEAISLDALVKALGVSKTVALDAILRQIGTVTVDLDALLRGEVSTSVNLDLFIQALDKQDISLDALVVARNLESVSVDALIKALGVSKTVALDVLLGEAFSATVDLDALIKGLGISTAVSLDVILGVSRKLRVKIVTTQYRQVNVVTSQYRKVDVVTTQNRKVKVLTGE